MTGYEHVFMGVITTIITSRSRSMSINVGTWDNWDLGH